MSKSSKRCLVVAMVSWIVIGFGLGCAPTSEEAELTQGQVLEVMRAEILQKPVLFERTAYNPTLEQVVERWIDPSIRKGIEQRYFGRWPRTAGEAKRIAGTLEAAAWRGVLDSSEGRALVEHQMRRYWESPNVEVSSSGEAVTIDLGVTPGVIELTSRGYYSIQRSEYEEDAAIVPAELVRRLKALQSEFPTAQRWRVSVIVRPYIARQQPIVYEYRQAEDRLFVYVHGEVYYSPTRLEGNLERLVAGESPMQTREMKLLPKHRVGKPLVLE